MPPNQNQFPAPGQPNPNDPGHDPYAFFMDPQKAPRRSLFGGGASNQKLTVIAGAAVVFIVLVIFLASLSSGGNAKSQELIAVAQSQQEVIRVATDGTKNSDSTDLQNFATNTVAVLSSDQRLLLADFAKNGKKISQKTLLQGKNPQTDQALAAALAANTYDTTFATTMDSELRDYQTKLAAITQGAGPSSASLLKQEVNDAAMLRKELQPELPTQPQ